MRDRRVEANVKYRLQQFIRMAASAIILFSVSAHSLAFQDETSTRLPVAVDDSFSFSAADVDADSDLDLLVGNLGQPSLLVNDGSGNFSAGSGLPLLDVDALGVVFADVDADSDPDIFIANARGQNLLLINNGSGSFADESAFRLPADFDVSTSAAFEDLNFDGSPDLVVANRGSRNHILLNDGSGAFILESDGRLDADNDQTSRVSVADVDGDGTPDLFFANDRGQNRLHLNSGLGVFTDASAAGLPVVEDETLDSVFVDVDLDGDPDLVLANGGTGVRLLLNDGGIFTDVTGSNIPVSAEYAIGVTVGDIDFDGSPDIAVANAGQDMVLVNDGSGVFTQSALPADLRRSFGLVLFDPDGDFDPDLIVATPAGQNRFQANDLAAPRIFLSVAPDYIEVTNPVTITVDVFDEDGIAFTNLTVTDPLGTVVNVPLVGGVGTFVPNMAGSHTAMVTTEDNLANVGLRSQIFEVFTQDTSAPTVTITATPAEVTFGETVAIQVNAVDDRGVTDRRADVNGANVPLDSSGRADYVTAAVGLHTVNGFADDAAGNTGTDTTIFNVLADNESPIVTLGLSAVTVDLANPLIISAGATDNIGVASLTVTVTGPTDPGGASVPLDGSGNGNYTPFLPGTHTVTVTATDPFGNTTVDTADFEAVGTPDTTAPTVTVTVVPATVAIGGSVTITVNATDDVLVSSRSLTINGTPAPLDAGGSYTYTPPVLGLYTALGSAEDPSGNTGSSSSDFRAVDPALDTTPPTVGITDPADSGEVSGQVDFSGTALDDTLVQYTLAYAPVESNDFVTFHTGDTPVTGTLLGALDTTLLDNGYYQVRLAAEDVNGLTSTVTQLFNVVGKLKLGVFSVSFQDKNVPVGRFPITVSRTYDTRDRAAVGDFGHGWNVELTQVELVANRLAGDNWEQVKSSGFIPSYQLVPSSPHFVTIKFGDDEEFKFRAQPNPSSQTLFPIQFLNSMNYVAVGDAKGSLVAGGATPDFVLPGGEGPSQIFDGSLNLYNPTLFVYTAEDGYQYRFGGGSNSVRYALSSVTDPSGLTVSLTPNGFTRSDGLSVSFVRDAEGRIEQITDPAGNVIGYEYDANGDLTAVTDALGNRSTYGYDANHYLTDIMDPLGRPVQRNEYDADGRLTAITDGSGNRIEMEYDPNNNTQITRDRRGNPTIYEYDANGNIISETNFPSVDGTPQAVVTTRAFDSDSQLTQEVLPDGAVNSFTYDTKGNVTQEVKDVGGLNLTRNFTFNAQSRPLTETDGRGNVETHTYDANGNDRLTTQDQAGFVTTFEYTNGRVTRETDPLGNNTRFEYDAMGNMTAQARYDGNGTPLNDGDDTLMRRMELTYDVLGNKLSETIIVDVAGTSTPSTTTFAYDANNRLISKTDPLGNASQIEYDAVGAKVAEVDPLGNRVEYSYNVLGDVTRVDFPDSSFKAFAYDVEGNRTLVTDRNGNATQYEYDAINRLTKVVFPDLSFRDRRYDIVGNLSGEIIESGQRTDHAYDAASRRVSTTQPEVYSAETDALLRPLTAYEYDANSNQTATVDARGNRTEMTYDGLDRLVETTLPDGDTIGTTFDPAGREIVRTDAAGLNTNYAYDALNRLVTTRLPAPQTGDPRPEALFTYDAMGKLLTQTDANSHVTQYGYDLAGNRTSHTLPGGQVQTSAYDAAGRMASQTDFNGDITTFGYNGVGRRTSVIYHDGTSITTVYAGEGQRLSITDSRGVTSFTYDNRKRLTNRTEPDALEVDYTYTATGKVASMTTSSGNTTTYTYDALDRLSTVADANSSTSAYSYDAVGNQSKVERANGTYTEYSYNNRNQLTGVVHKFSDDSVISQHVYTLDSNGLRTRMDELPLGNNVAYLYDDNARLLRETRTGGNAYDTQYAYDAVGNRTLMDKDGTVTTYTYDVNDRIVSDGTGTYVYDDNGNLTSITVGAASTLFGYDAGDSMVSTTAPGGAVTTYEYDADDFRVGRTDASGTQRFLTDIRSNTGLVQVIEEQNDTGTVLSEYTYGLELLTQRRGTALSQYHPDGLGSIRTLTDATESATDTYTFDAYGNEVASTGTTQNNYRFAGEQFDPNSGFYYLRKRYYDPVNGRFVSVDPAVGDPMTPVSLHRYLYANDNPVNYTDPTGRFSLVSINVSMSIQTTIRSIYTKNLIKFFFAAAKIAYCTLEPAYKMQTMGLDMIANNMPGGEHLVMQAHGQIAAGYKAIGRRAAQVYEDTLNEVIDFKIEFRTVVDDIQDMLSNPFGSLPLPPEIAEVINFYEQASGWVDGFEEGYRKAKEGYEAFTIGSACDQFTFLDDNADTLLSIMPSF